MVSSSIPESYFLHPTPHVPNSKLPVLIYRDCLGNDPSPDSIKAQIEPNNWLRGGQWKAYTAAHFHSVTHECYAVFEGHSTLLLGKSPLDSDDKGLKVELKKGDIIVLPAGVSHHSVESYSDDYEYVGLYPNGSPHWDNNFCKASADETQEKADTARSVAVPDFDPIFGQGGYLPQIWNRALNGQE